jgi:hypothetical protein
MSRNRSARRIVVTLVATAAVAACAKPPTQAISQADQADKAALAAGAEQYAPDAVAKVTQAKAALDAELAAQSERMSLRRSYKQATQLAAAYQQAAEQATTAATAAKEQAKQDATTLISQTQAALDEVKGMLAAAPVGKGSRADLAALRTDLETAANNLAQAQASITAENYLEAKTQATSARDLVDKVKAAVEQARSMRKSS